MSEGGDCVGAVQQFPPLGQHGTGSLGGGFQLLPAPPVFQDALRAIAPVQVGALHEVPDALQLPLDIFQLGLHGFQLSPRLVVAASDQNAVSFALSPGEAHDAPAGCI